MTENKNYTNLPQEEEELDIKSSRYCSNRRCSHCIDNP